MKYLVALSLLLVSCSNIMNNPMATDDQKTSQFIVEHKGLSKDALYSSVMKAMGIVYKSSEAVIEVSDRDGGNIVGNGYASVTTTCKGGVYSNLPFNVRYKVIITIKDGKVRYQYNPTIEQVGQIKSSDCSPNSDCSKMFEYMRETECFWIPMSAYFKTITEQITQIVNQKDDF